MTKIIMEKNNLPPADCILHEKQDWDAKETLVVYPLHLSPVKKDLHVIVAL